MWGEGGVLLRPGDFFNTYNAILKLKVTPNTWTFKKE